MNGMQTPDLIEALAADLRPVRRGTAARRLAIGIGTGCLIAVALMLVSLGIRPDLAAATGASHFWTKLGYTLLLGLAGLWAVGRIARPAGDVTAQALVMGLVVAAIAAIAAIEIVRAPGDARMPMLMGSTALRCPWLIVLIGLPIFAGLTWAVRGLAPTRLRLAGAVVGIASGAAGSWVYSMHCPETAIPFVAIWYTAGIAVLGGIGLLLGPRLLRW